MRSPFVQAVLALAASSVASAQTWSECNPMQRTDCPNNPALAGTYDYTYGSDAPMFTAIGSRDMLLYDVGTDGAHFRVEKTGDAPTIASYFYIMWGKFEVTMKSAPGAGIVSSMVLQSLTLDEIDWEWLGGKPLEAQSNYFGKGNTATYDRGAFHNVTATDFHTYGFEWTEQMINWTIDGQVVRTLLPSQVKGDYYPQTPMQCRIGAWSGGDPANQPGVIEWAGGPTDYSKGPYDMIVQRIYVQDYSSGKEYHYGDQTGSWKSIQAIDGVVGAGPQTGPGNRPASLPAGYGTYKSTVTSGYESSTTKSEPSPGTETPGFGDPANPRTKASPTPSPLSSSPLLLHGSLNSFVTETAPVATRTAAAGITGTGYWAIPTNGSAPRVTGKPVNEISLGGAIRMTSVANSVMIMAGLVIISIL
ncbi:hypothetical protein RUND412_000244 [Rhizina undulata]